MPEILATLLSTVTLISIIVVLHRYEHRALQDLDLPSGLTLNGLIALLSTILRVTLMVPVGSALSQELWLWLRQRSRDSNPRRELQDLEISDAASRGAWESLLFLIHTRRRHVPEKVQKG